MIVQQTIEARKEVSPGLEDILLKRGFQFIKTEVVVWWWSPDPVYKYIFMSDVWVFGEIQSAFFEYEKQYDKENPAK